MICVEIGSTINPNFFATYFSIFGFIEEKFPTGPDIAQVEISFLAFFHVRVYCACEI